MSSLNAPQKPKTWWDPVTIFFVIFCLAGCFILLWSAADWFALIGGLRKDASFCAINSYWDCDRATLSPMGSLLGLPTGVFGAAWFLSVIFLGLASSRLRPALLILLGLGLLVVGFLGFYLFFVLKIGCIVCVSAYVCILGACVSGFALSRRSGALISDMQSVLILFLVLLMHGLYTWGQVSDLAKKDAPPDEFQAWIQSLPIQNFNAQSPLVSGPSDAKITVLEFSDFGCPYCALAAGTMVSYLKMQPDVRVIFQPYPLDSACNPKMQRPMHARSCDWSKATLCAATQNQGWKMHDEIFARTRRGEELPLVSELAPQMVPDPAAFEACYKSPQTEALLSDLVKAANDIEIASTPTFIVNGRVIKGVISVSLLERLLGELRK